MAPPPASTLPPQTLRLLRLAMLAGILAIGAVLWFVAREQAPVLDAERAGMVQIGFYVLAHVALGAMLLLRKPFRAAGPAQRGMLFIAGHAIGELPAVLGAVCILLLGTAVPFAVGLLVFLVAFLFFPLDEDPR